jgi:hypothetical protein
VIRWSPSTIPSSLPVFKKVAFEVDDEIEDDMDEEEEEGVGELLRFYEELGKEFLARGACADVDAPHQGFECCGMCVDLDG